MSSKDPTAKAPPQKPMDSTVERPKKGVKRPPEPPAPISRKLGPWDYAAHAISMPGERTMLTPLDKPEVGMAKAHRAEPKGLSWLPNDDGASGYAPNAPGAQTDLYSDMGIDPETKRSVWSNDQRPQLKTGDPAKDIGAEVPTKNRGRLSRLFGFKGR